MSAVSEEDTEGVSPVVDNGAEDDGPAAADAAVAEGTANVALTVETSDESIIPLSSLSLSGMSTLCRELGKCHARMHMRSGSLWH